MNAPAPLLALSCLCGSLRRATRAVTRAYAVELRGTALNPTRFTLLYALDRLGPTTPRALGQALAIQSSTLSRTLPPLERWGWIRAERGNGRRVLRWEITITGATRLVAATHAWRRAQRGLRGRLDDHYWVPIPRELAAVTSAAQALFDAF